MGFANSAPEPNAQADNTTSATPIARSAAADTTAGRLVGRMAGVSMAADASKGQGSWQDLRPVVTMPPLVTIETVGTCVTRPEGRRSMPDRVTPRRALGMLLAVAILFAAAPMTLAADPAERAG